jgi:Mycothiol maleylpyruvate isomerase N-terminal domain
VSTSASYVAENRASLQRLRDLVARLSDDDLTRILPSGWSVADTLGHLAFYDRRASVLFERFTAEGPFASSEDVDTINAVIPYLTRRIPPRVMAEEVLAAAAAADEAVAALPDSLLNDAELQKWVRLSRAKHRNEHVEQIEAALG